MPIPSLRSAQPPVNAQWFREQTARVRRARETATRALAAAREREASLRERYEREARAIRDRYPAAGRDGVARAERRGALDAARLRFRDEVEPVLRDATDAATKAATEARELLAAAREAARGALDPFSALRRATRGPGGRALTDVEAASYRAAMIATAEAASFVELRGLAQQAVDESNLLLAHAVLTALEKRRPKDRPVDPAELRAALPLPELAEARVAVAALVVEGRALADAWAEWAIGDAAPPPGTGTRRIAAAIATADPDAAIVGLIDDYARLAALAPESLRRLAGDDPPADAIGGVARLASAMAEGSAS